MDLRIIYFLRIDPLSTLAYYSINSLSQYECCYCRFFFLLHSFYILSPSLSIYLLAHTLHLDCVSCGLFLLCALCVNRFWLLILLPSLVLACFRWLFHCDGVNIVLYIVFQMYVNILFSSFWGNQDIIPIGSLLIHTKYPAHYKTPTTR